ncbi:glycosyltransferase family 2 protein [Candidatus Kaiserbacteria bacterium]|nr:glycosyltransferase family 2 protein [Candidatus Kaiserbacteria bacterium]
MVQASIIIRAYNAEATIARALESVLKQDVSYTYEIVVVDDGSQDRTVSIANEFLRENVRLIEQGNHGVSSAANTGFSAARGKAILLLDADDELLPSVALGLEALISSPADYVYGDYIEEYRGETSRVHASDPFKVPAGAVIWRRERLVDAGGFKSETVFPEYEVLLKMWDIWKGIHVPEPFFVYHRTDTSITADKERIAESIRLLKQKFPARSKEIDLIRNYDPLAL